jgi:anti-sigma factor RsiW
MINHDPRCRQVRRLLPLLAGDAGGMDLAWDDRRAVERHLIGCGACRAERDSLSAAVGLLRLAGAVTPVAMVDTRSIWPDLSRQIRGSRREFRPQRWFGLGFGHSVGLAASLLLLGAMIGLLGSRLANSTPERLATTPVSLNSAVANAPGAGPRPSAPSSGPAQIAGGIAPGLLPAPAANVNLDVDAKGASARLRDPQRSQ